MIIDYRSAKQENVFIDDICGSKVKMIQIKDGTRLIEKSDFLKLPPVKLFTQGILNNPLFKLTATISSTINTLRYKPQMIVLPPIDLCTPSLVNHPLFKKTGIITLTAKYLNEEVEVLVDETGDTILAHDTTLLEDIVDEVVELMEMLNLEEQPKKVQDAIAWCKKFHEEASTPHSAG